MLILGISTSLGQFSLIFTENNQLIYHSKWTEIENPKDVQLLLEKGLEYINKTVRDISSIIVDIGPGGTSSVRTGVALANSIAFSTGISVCPFSSLELAGMQVWEKHQIPVVSTVKSIKGNAFIGYYKKENDYRILYGKIAEILPELLNGVEKFAVVGYHRPKILELFPNKTVIDTGLKHGDLESIIDKQEFFLKRAITFPHFAIPVTEQNVGMDKVDKMVDCLKNGGVAVFPTDTVFGIGASPSHPKAIDAIYDLKERPKNRFLPIMVASASQLEALGLDVNENARKLIASDYVPGALSLILGFVEKPTVAWLEGREEIAIRIPNDKRLLKVLEKAGPLMVTSANRHGQPTPTNADAIVQQLNGQADIVIYDGIGREVPSTIVNCRTNPPIIEREGVISTEAIRKILL